MANILTAIPFNATHMRHWITTDADTGVDEHYIQIWALSAHPYYYQGVNTIIVTTQPDDNKVFSPNSWWPEERPDPSKTIIAHQSKEDIRDLVLDFAHGRTDYKNTILKVITGWVSINFPKATGWLNLPLDK